MKDFMDGKESYHKCSWESIKTQFATGDYVIIALGTNDTSQISAYNKNPEKGYSAEQFKNWYKEIAADVKAKGAHLIVLTPPAAAYTVKDGKFIGTDEWAATQALFELRDEVDGITVIDFKTDKGKSLSLMPRRACPFLCGRKERAERFALRGSFDSPP